MYLLAVAKSIREAAFQAHHLEFPPEVYKGTLHAHFELVFAQTWLLRGVHDCAQGFQNHLEGW